MSDSKSQMDSQEKEIEQLSADINPSKDEVPDSLAEATTAPLTDDELGDNATQDDIKK